MSQNNNYRIEPLKRDNYDTWKLQARAVLTRNGLWKYVSGESPRPTSDEERNKWDELDLNAKSELILIISPSELKQIKNCEKSKDIWDTLERHFHSKGPARKAALLKHLILHKMNDEDDVRTHLNDFSDTVDKLNDMDIKINDDLLSIMMLYSLPVSYENFRIAIESRDELPSPENLKIKIIEENEARNKNVPSTSSQGAYLGKNKFQRNNRNFSKNKKYEKENNTNESNQDCSKCRCQPRNRNSKSHYYTKNNNKSLKIEECYSNIGDSKFEKEEWCLDSGCTSHMCALKDKFENLDLNSNNGKLKLASESSTAEIKGSGNVRLKLPNKNNFYRSVDLTKTLYVPSLSTNLISVSKATDNGCTVLFTNNYAKIMDENKKTVLTASKTSTGLYMINSRGINKQSTFKATDDSINIWHKKLGHLNEADLKHALKNNLVKGLDFKPNSKLDECETCIKGKMSRLPFPTNKESKVSKLLHTIHSDVWGPCRTQTPGGSRYFVTFIDEASRYCKIYFLKQKNEVIEKFKQYKNETENETGFKIKYFQTDNGRAEYCTKQFDEYLKNHGIQRRLSAPYTPQQNGLAERKNRSLLERARCMMIDAKLPDMFWAEAVNTANYLLNRSPCKHLNGKIPFEKWAAFTPSVRHLQVFGNKTFVLKKGPKRSKLESKADEGIFMGYSDVSKAFRIWIPRLKNIIVSRDVKVLNKFYYEKGEFQDENWLSLETNINSEEKEDENTVIIPYNNEKLTTNNGNNKSKENSTENNSEIKNNNLNEDMESQGDENQRPQRDRKPPFWTKDYDMSFLCDEQDASQVENHNEWHEAIKSEIRSHIKNETWQISDSKPNKNIIDFRMILKNKYHSDGTLERKKARLVARGFAQKPNIDFSETYAPVVKLSSIRMILAAAAENQMKVHQLDVSTAYLNGDIEDGIEIHMKVPPYLEKYIQEILLEESLNEDKTLFLKAKSMLEELRKGEKHNKVCSLKRSLYGLKQAGRRWFLKLDETLKEIGFKPSEADPCVYMGSIGGEKVIIAVYVDDLILSSASDVALIKTKEILTKTFDMRDLGELKYCLGIEFSKNKNTFSANQKKYIREILKRFNMEDCKPAITPMEVGLKLGKMDASTMTPEHPYQNLIGSLMYLAVATRPDISFAVSYLSQFNTCHGNEHWQAAKRVLRYLKGTINLALTYRKTNANKQVIGWADADWGSCTIDRKSYTGYCFQLAGGPISWESRKQRTVALSTAEAEFMALAEAAKEALHIKKLANDIGIPHKKISILNDNQAAQKLSTNPIVSSRSKHINLKEHFIRDAIQSGDITLTYQPSSRMAADILTKSISGPKHKEFCTVLGLLDESVPVARKGEC